MDPSSKKPSQRLEEEVKRRSLLSSSAERLPTRVRQPPRRKLSGRPPQQSQNAESSLTPSIHLRILLSALAISSRTRLVWRSPSSQPRPITLCSFMEASAWGKLIY